MAEIPKNVSMNVDLVISDKTAQGMCRLLTDYLNEHWEKNIEVVLLNGDSEVAREVRLVEERV